MIGRIVLSALRVLLLGAVPSQVTAQLPEAPRTLLLDTATIEVGGTRGMALTIAPLPQRLLPMRVMLTGPDGRELVLWSGNTIERPRWNGTVDGQAPTSGRYDLVAEVGRAPESVRIRRPVQVSLDGGDTMPQVRLPEADTILIRDFQAEDRRRQRGILLTIGGVGTSLLASALVSQVVASSAPESPARYAVAAAYLGGFATTAWGAARLFWGASKPVQVPVVVPLESNIRRNRAARTAPIRLTLTFLD